MSRGESPGLLHRASSLQPGWAKDATGNHVRMSCPWQTVKGQMNVRTKKEITNSKRREVKDKTRGTEQGRRRQAEIPKNKGQTEGSARAEAARGSLCPRKEALGAQGSGRDQWGRLRPDV